MAFQFPKFSGRPQPEATLTDLNKTVGKTVARVEFGEQVTDAKSHKADALVLHFTDGSSLALTVHSNANSLASPPDGLKPRDFCTFLSVFWAPDVSK